MNNRIYLYQYAAIIATVLSLGSINGAAYAATADQAVYKTPQLAVKTLQSAVKNNNIQALLNIFGHQYKLVIDTSDKAAEKVRRYEFYKSIEAGYKLEKVSADKLTILIGKEAMPFGIPLTKTKSGWQFDTLAGIEKVVNKRIGQNELAAIAACNAVHAAQLEYAKVDHDNDGVLEFAQKFKSIPGDRDGLYWASPKGADSSEKSPLEKFVSDAGDYLYARTTSRDPYKGYFFKIVTSQGKGAAGGQSNYLVNNNMTAGFGVIAWPAEYANTGVMTFMMNHEGSILKADLGKDTSSVVAGMTSINPDKSWSPVRLSSQ